MDEVTPPVPILVLISFEIQSSEDVMSLLRRMNITSIPHYSGIIRVVVGNDVEDTIKFLELIDVLDEQP